MTARRRSRRLPALAFAGALLWIAALPAPALASDDEEVFGPDEAQTPLLPIPGLLRPKGAPPAPAAAGDKAPVVVGGCAAEPLSSVGERLPFGPGEALSYDVAVLGIRTGRIRVKMGERTTIDGVPVYALHAQAKTTGFMTVLGEIDGRMVSFFDPSTLLPVRMVNQTKYMTPFKAPSMNREDAAFGANGSAVGRLMYRTPEEGEQVRKAKARATSDLLDVLSVVYYVRSRKLEEGAPFCFEIFHRRRLCRGEGKVGPLEVVTPPYGSRRARRIDATLRRLGGGNDAPPPRPVQVWVSNDADRLPLLVKTPDRVGNIEVRLLAFTPGRRLVRAGP